MITLVPIHSTMLGLSRRIEYSTVCIVLLLGLVALYTNSCGDFVAPKVDDLSATHTGSLLVNFFINDGVHPNDTVVVELQPGNYRLENQAWKKFFFESLPPGLYNLRLHSGIYYKYTVIVLIEAGKQTIVFDNYFWVAKNNPPLQPSHPQPADGAIINHDSLSLNLSWECSDPETERVSYNVLFSTNKSFNPSYNVTPTVLQQPRYDNLYLPSSGTVYWSVAARDTKGNMVSSPIWTFTVRTRKPELVLYLPFHQNAKDSSIYQSNVSAYNTAYIPDRHGNKQEALLIDSVENSSVQINWSSLLPFHTGEDFSLSFWLRNDKCMDSISSPLPLFSNYDSNNSISVIRGWRLGLKSNSSFSLFVGRDRYYVNLPPTTLLCNGEWKHVVLLFHGMGNKAEFYLDGRFVANTPATNFYLLAESMTPFIIGYSTSFNREKKYRLGIDEVRLYRGILSNEQIIDLSRE